MWQFALKCSQRCFVIQNQPPATAADTTAAVCVCVLPCLLTALPLYVVRRSILNALDSLKHAFRLFYLRCPPFALDYDAILLYFYSAPRLLFLPAGVAADSGMFARRVVRGATTMSATKYFCPAYGYRGSPLFSALKKTTTGRGVALRTACSVARRGTCTRRAGQAGNGNGNGQKDDGSRRLGREIARALESKRTRLVLHFDLNKTLIMVDPAGRKTQSQVLLHTNYMYCCNPGLLCGSDCQ